MVNIDDDSDHGGDGYGDVMMVMLETVETVMMIMVKMTIKDLSLERLPLLVIVEDKSLNRVRSPLNQVDVPAVLQLSGLEVIIKN